MAENDLSSALSVSGAQELLEKLQGVTLPAELEEKKKEFLEALNQAVQSDSSTPQIPPPRPSKKAPKEAPPEPAEVIAEEEDGLYGDTLPPPPPQLLEENGSTVQEDQNYEITEGENSQGVIQVQEDQNYEITEGENSQGVIQEDAEYELLPSEQAAEQEDFYADIDNFMTGGPPAVPSPQLPSSPPTAECEVDYTLPVKIAHITGIIKQGWLDKHKKDGQFSFLNPFQRRYCVLVKHALYYYQNIKDKCQKGQIILNGYHVVYPPKQVAGAKQLDRCFELNGPGKRKFQVIKFMAPTKEDAKEWVDLLCDQLNQTLSRRQSERLTAMEKKSAENDKDNSEEGSERGSLSGVEGVDGGPDDMYEPLPDGPESEDLYEPIPGDQQAPSLVQSSAPMAMPLPVPPTVSSIPSVPVPSLPSSPPTTASTEGVEEDDGELYDDVAQPAIIQQIQLKQQEEGQVNQDTQPEDQPEAPAAPPRPPKQDVSKQTEPEVAVPEPVKEEKPEENINPADVYVALWNCSADGEYELDFTRGDFIHVHKKLSADWWIGVRMETKEFSIGLVPSAFLQEAYAY